MFMPKLNEAGSDVTISEWMVAVGDRVALDDPVLAVETDKVVVEAPSTVSGVVLRLLVAPGQTVAVGEPILEVE
jgi:pyruvate/2-oxoglutarate dehydrogenase complex dihydrolipoamide acyltransferase (E2) component